MEDRSFTTRLLRQARDGDPESLNHLYRRIGNRLNAVVRLRLGQGLAGLVEVEDVIQEVLIRASANLGSFEKDNSRSLFAWLAIIAGNVIRDLAAFHQRDKRDLRKTLRGEERVDDLVARHRSALSGLIRDQQMDQLEAAMAQLEEGDRQVILLRYFEERSFVEMASILEKREDACRMMFSRAMARLTIQMQDQL